MKQRYLYTILAVIMMAVFCPATIQAKRVVVPEMYLFGMAASFNDTIVYFTDIQRVDSCWINTKNNFLQSREVMSKQLREHLATKHDQPNRTCIVFYAQKRSRIEKKFLKIKKLYTKSKDGQQHFDLRYLPDGEFKFVPLDLTGLDEEERLQAIEDAKQAKIDKKAAKEQKKADKQARKEAKQNRKAARKDAGEE